MIKALDHVVLICADLPDATATYETLLGTPPAWRSEDIASSTGTVLFQLENTALELMGATTPGPAKEKLTTLLGGRPARLTTLVFRSDDLAADHHLFTRRGLACSDITPGSSRDLDGRGTCSWRRFRCPDEVCAGIKTFVLSPDAAPLPSRAAAPHSVHRMDHIVLNTPNPDRLAAHYGARLGLDLRLDRTSEDWGARFIFFDAGGVTLEAIHRSGEANAPEGPDTLWGLAWRVTDLSAAHQRLTEAGCAVSDIRTGRKPGTEVFTLKTGALGVPTLFISDAAS